LYVLFLLCDLVWLISGYNFSDVGFNQKTNNTYKEPNKNDPTEIKMTSKILKPVLLVSKLEGVVVVSLYVVVEEDEDANGV
jgi:hypothetical protein